MAELLSVNIGTAVPNPFKAVPSTGIDKVPQTGPVEVRDPGPKRTGLGSGLVGDHIGDVQHHGGRDQAVYAFAREDLDGWEARLGRPLRNGFFGENLTTAGLDVTEALLGERWRVGDEVELVVTSPRIPCSTFRGWLDEPRWLRVFTEQARPGAYLAVVTPGVVRSGDRIRVVHRPDHGVTIGLTYRAMMTEHALRPRLLDAGPDLIEELAEFVAPRS